MRQRPLAALLAAFVMTSVLVAQEPSNSQRPAAYDDCSMASTVKWQPTR